MKRMLHGLLVSIAVFLISVSNASAQVDRATILGTVKDTSDAVVPGATVTARNVATDVPSQSISDAQGSFVIGGLIPGAYVVEVELTGFQKRSRRVDWTPARALASISASRSAPSSRTSRSSVCRR